MNRKFCALIWSALLISGGVTANTDSGSRSLTHIGCHLSDGTCYVTISGNPVGPSACSHTSVRWHKESENSDRVFTLLTAAYMGNQKVNFRISDSCYEKQPNFPTFHHFNLVQE